MGIILYTQDFNTVDKSNLAEAYIQSQSSAVFDITLRFLIFSSAEFSHQKHWIVILAHIIEAFRETLAYYNHLFTNKRFTTSNIIDFFWYYWKPARLLLEINLLIDTFPKELCDKYPMSLNSYILSFLNRNLPLIKRAITDLVGDIQDRNLPAKDVSFLYLETLQCMLIVDNVGIKEKYNQQIDFVEFTRVLELPLNTGILITQKIPEKLSAIHQL